MNNESSRLDVRVQADGNRLAVHHDVGHGIAACAGDDQGLAGSGRGCFSRSISIMSLLSLIATVMDINVSDNLI